MNHSVSATSKLSSASGASYAQSSFSPLNVSKSTDLSFFNLFQTLQQTSVLQGSVQYTELNPSLGKPPEDEEPIIQKDVSHIKEQNKPSSLQEANPSKLSELDEDVIFIQHTFKAEESQQMEQWLTHLVQQPNGLPVPWFFQMVQDLGTSTSSGQSSGFSGQLIDAIQQAYKSGGSIRIALENQTDLILKFSQGRVSAEFLSENPTIQATLQETVAQLRRQLEEKRLPVGEITYRDQQHDQEREQLFDSKENQSEQPDEQA